MPTTKTMTEPTKTPSITDAQIRTLRDEARAAGDGAQVHICGLALGDEEPVTDADAFEARYGGGGFASWERDAILACETRSAARAECARVIADAVAMDND
jgi:hypothetical protein